MSVNFSKMIYFLAIPLSMLIASALSMGTRSVNLALETSLLFDTADRRHLPLLKSMRSILDTLYTALSPRASMRAKDETSEDILMKFLNELGDVVLSYEDDDVRTIIEALHEESESFYEKKKTVYDPMIHNPKLRMYVKNTLKEWMSSNPFEMKDKLSILQKNMNSYKLLQEFNEIFNVDDELTLKTFLNYFREYPKSRNVMKLSTLVKDASRFIIFERYDNLNEKSKTKIQNAVNNIFGIVNTKDREETSGSKNPKEVMGEEKKNETTHSDDSEEYDGTHIIDTEAGEVKVSLNQDETKTNTTTYSLFY